MWLISVYFLFTPFLFTVNINVDICIPAIVDIIHDMYSNGGEEDRQYLEELYGRDVIQGFQDSDLSKDWLKENSKKCPNCEANIQVLVQHNNIAHDFYSHIFLQHINNLATVMLRHCFSTRTNV